MKDWTYYEECGMKMPYLAEITVELKKQIDEIMLTKAERLAAYEQAELDAKAEFKLQLKRFREAQQKKRNEFWTDARQELQYDRALAEPGIKALEDLAYERGATAGYYQVYVELDELTQLITSILPHVKR